MTYAHDLAIWNVAALLRIYGVNGELMRAVRSVYDNGKACASVQGQKSDLFGVGQGVRQGCAMSPWLFNIFNGQHCEGGKAEV